MCIRDSNTPYPLLHDGRYYYLNVTEDVWYRADSATGSYRFDARTPDTIKALVDAGEKEEPTAAEQAITEANAPEIVVTTEPAELIVTEGPAAFVPLVDDLLVLQNSDDDVFMHLSEQEYHIVLAGRWYRSNSLDGPWTFQSSDQLPAAFANIPRDSSQADSRVYVAGTAEAEDAVLDAQVPQTAVVQRGEVDMQVDYDGDPQFAPVDGTGMRYANNSGSTVILSDGLYYLVEDGVWYVSTTANGPWQVATQRPAQVVTILPTSPVYNVKYVHVYHSTPNVVYVGYTPGYFGSYVYHGTVFYGSGWYYRPWVSPYTYYPRPSTWGFHVSYNPWYGWGFGVSWGWGPFSFNYWSGGYWHHHHHWHHRHYGYWGPRGYRPRHGHGYGRHRYAHNGPRPESYGRHDNLYRDSRQRARVVDSRDRYSGGRSGRYDDSKLANLSSSRQKKKQDFTRGKNTASLKPAPVQRSDLRAKARQRNAAFDTQPAKLMAANTAKPKSARYQKAVTRENPPQPKQYKAPQQKQYKAPQQKQYKAPQQKQYKAPQQKQYKAPQQQQYKAPQQQQYKAPQQQQYKAPQQKQYKAPQQKQYKAPQQKQYKAPQQQQYKAPQQQYKAPQQQHKAPQQNLKASNRGGIERRQGFNDRKHP